MDLIVGLGFLLFIIWCFLILIGIKKLFRLTSQFMEYLNDGNRSVYIFGAAALIGVITLLEHTQVMIGVFVCILFDLLILRYWHQIKKRRFINRVVMIFFLFFLIEIIGLLFIIKDHAALEKELKKTDRFLHIGRQ